MNKYSLEGMYDNLNLIMTNWSNDSIIYLFLILKNNNLALSLIYLDDFLCATLFVTVVV